MADYVIITHTDLDGIASAAVYCRLSKGCNPSEARIFFVEPDSLVHVLKDILGSLGEESIVAISDLGMNGDFIDDVASIVRDAVERGARITWFDHHVWEEEWIGKLARAGAHVIIDRSTCAAGVVYKGLGGGDEVAEEIVSATCAADLWRWDHPLAGKLFRIVGRYRGVRGDKWKRYLLENLYRGIIWSDELQEVLEEYVDRELKGYARALSRVKVFDVAGCRVALLARHRGPPNNSLLASYILSKTGADVVAITRSFRSISLRSRRIDVRRIAVELGGGGHPVASGAPLKPPLPLRILGMILPPILSEWVRRRLVAAINRVGCVEL